MRAITSSSSEREPQPFCFALRRDKEKDPHANIRCGFFCFGIGYTLFEYAGRAEGGPSFNPRTTIDSL